MKTDKENNNQAPLDPENVRAEYAALTQYCGQVIGSRITAAAIYFIGIAFIMHAGLSPSKLFLMLFFSIGMWVVEIRNRGLVCALGGRGMQIEREYWGYKDERAYHPFFQRMLRPKIDGIQRPPPDPVRILFYRNQEPPQWVERFISHTLGFDIVYLGVIAYSLWHLELRHLLLG